MATWVALGCALLVLAFGSKALSLLIRVVLLAVHKVGLLSNIRVDEWTTLQVTIQAVHIRVWRNVWKFVRSPTQHPLVSVEVAAVHILVICRDESTPQQAPHAESIGTPGLIHSGDVYWSQLDTGTSFKSLDHPQWQRVRTWMHRIPFVWFLFPVVGVSVSGVDIDVVRDSSVESRSIMRLQNGQVDVRFVYKMNEGEVELLVSMCRQAAAVLALPAIGVEGTIYEVGVVIAAPVSRVAEDIRAPLPCSLRVHCEGISCSVDVATMMKETIKTQRREPSRTYPAALVVKDGLPVFEQAVLSSYGLLVLRLAELIPDVNIRICNVRASLVNGANKIEGTIHAIECQLKDTSRHRAIDRSQGRSQRAGTTAEERKLVIDIDCLQVSTELASSQSSSVCIEGIKVEGDTRLVMCSIRGSQFEPSQQQSGVLLSWITRHTAELRGLSVSLADDIAPWFEVVFATPEDVGVCCTPITPRNDDDDIETTGSFWDSVVVMETQVQIKLLRAEVLCQSRKKCCAVLPNGVPDIGLSIEEVVVFVHPFASEESLGVRAMADLQASRLKMFYSQSSHILRTSFLSIDSVRVLIEPVCVLGSGVTPAEVEMEAEWLEVRWTPEAMRAIGGMLDFGIVTLAPLLRERYDWTQDEHWDRGAPQSVPSMRPMTQVVEDTTLPTEVIKFRCKVKRSLVLFSHCHHGRNHVDYVTVDTLNMSVEETTGRFRLSILDTKICNVEGESEFHNPSQEPFTQQQLRRRRPSTFLTNHSQPQAGRRRGAPVVRVEGSPFFSVKIFALEENKIMMCPMKVLDLFVDGVHCTWDMKTQERIVELIRRITFSSWEMLYCMRSAYGVHCTPPAGRYNREGGLNGVIDNAAECDDAERLLQKLISAGGDALNRLRASNIDLNAVFGSQEAAFALHVGVFESDDLPELWTFENVTLTLGGSLKLLDVDRVLVRHTVEKRRDYVFGFFEETLRLRKTACGRIPKDCPRHDGMMIDIEGLRACLSIQVDMGAVVDAIQADTAPFITSHMKSFQSPWRPHEDSFYNFFLKIPSTPGQPRVWLQLSHLQIECFDKPMEAWLEHVYPLWIEELAEQELRSQLLDEQVNALKLTNVEMLMSDETANGMQYLLQEKSSKIYVHKVRRLQDNLRSGARPNPLHSGSILTVRIGSVEVDIFSEPNQRTVTGLIRELDEATSAVDQALRTAGLDPHEFGPKYAFLLHQHLNVCVLDTSVRMRNFPTPVAVVEQVKVGGHVIVAATKPPDAVLYAFALTAAARCFADLEVSIEHPVILFGPAYIYSMQELAAIAERVLPSLILDVDQAHRSAPWDIARRLLHGKLRLNVREMAIRLFASSTTFEVSDYLEVGVQEIGVLCIRGERAGADVNVERLTVKIEPDALVNIAEITSLKIHAEATWTAKRNALMHWFLPIEYYKYGSQSSGGVIVMDFQEAAIWNGNSVDVAASLRGFSGTGVSLSISGKLAPKTSAMILTRRDIASRSAIVLYTKHVEWLIQFGRVYGALLKFRGRRRQGKDCVTGASASCSQLPSTVDRFLRIFKGITIEEFGIIGLDVALYHSEKSQVGLRACINDKIAFCGSINVSAGDDHSADPSRLEYPRHVSIDWNEFTFIVADVSLAVSDVQVRICTPSTGSRGESLVSIRDVCLNVGGDGGGSHGTQSPFDFTSLHSELVDKAAPADESRSSRLSSFKSLSPSPLMPAQAAEERTDAVRTKSKKTILEHFAIPQHNPYQFRNDNGDATDGKNQVCSGSEHEDSQARTSSRSRIQAAFVKDFRQQGFLLGLSASEIRVLVTLDTVETMVDIVENWVHVVRASLPELSRVPDEILKPSAGQENNTPHATSMESPKKATSLADDPKFGPIFHASNPIPNNRTPSFSLDLPTETNSSGTAQLSPGSSASVVEPFLIVRFMDCQINFQDHQNKGSVLFAMSRGTVRHSRSRDVQHELVDVKVDGVQLFTAPLDIDVRSRVIWLRTLEDRFTYCPSSFGLLRQVVAPIPTTAMIWIDRNITVVNRVDLCVPTVQIGMNVDSKNILENLATALVSVITAKLAEYQAPDYSKMLQGFRGTQSQAGVQSSLQQLLLAKKQLKWRIAELHWRHSCRWNYQVTERASLAMQAVEGIRHGAFDLDPVSSPFLHAHRLSSASLVSSIGTSISLSGSTTTHVESASDELQRLQQQHESIGDVLRSLVAAELVKRQPNPNVQLAFTLQDASLTLSAANSDIVSAAMTNLSVKLKMYEDQSGTFALTIQDVCCKNLTPNTPYPELLIPLNNSKSWSGDEMFVRIDAEVAPPVGGIKIVRHFEINVHPMQVCLSYDLILQLVAFFTSISGPSVRQEEKKAEMRSQFLAAPQHSGSSGGEGLLKKAVKVAGKAAHPLTHGLGRHRGDNDQPTDPRVKAMQALQEEATEWISRVARAEASKSNAGEDEASPSTGNEKDVSEMRDRANNNILFKRIRLGTVEVMVSFKNKKSNSSGAAPQQALEDMRGFEVKIHSLVYSDKTCSLMDLLLRIRRDVILDVLSQVGRNFTNVANFLRDQLDITRWGAFDALAPLKSLSTAITGSSQTPLTIPPSLANAPSSPGALSVEMLQRSPRISRDASYPSMPPMPVDASKVFQLELPESHPSRRKKQTPQPRPTEPVGKVGDTSAVPISPAASEKDDGDASSTSASGGGKTRKTLSSFFGKSKSKKTTEGATALTTESEETAS